MDKTIKHIIILFFIVAAPIASADSCENQPKVFDTKIIGPMGPILAKLQAIIPGVCQETLDFSGAGNDGFAVKLRSLKDIGEEKLEGEFEIVFRRCVGPNQWKTVSRNHHYNLKSNSVKKEFSAKFVKRDVLVGMEGGFNTKVTDLELRGTTYWGKFELSSTNGLKPEEYQFFKEHGVLKKPIYFKTLSETIIELNIESRGAYKVCVGLSSC